MRKFQEGAVCIIDIDEVVEIDTTALPRDLDRNRAVSREHMTSTDIKWHGGTLANTRTILREGWAEGLARVSKLSDEFRTTLDPPKSFRRRQQWREDGDEPSWERERQGKTDIWRTARRQTMVGPTTVHLLCPWSHSAYQSADRIVWNGVVLSVLTDLLESAGYRIAATLTNTLRLPDGSYLMALVHVKQPQMPLDLASMVPVVAHPSPYRWFGIDFATLAPTFCGSGMGMPISMHSIPDVPSKPRDGLILKSVYTEIEARAEIKRVLDLFSNGNPASSHDETEELWGGTL